MRGCLRLAEIPYTWAVELRNWGYDSGRLAVRRVGVPVVSVGNMTTGGTGKTPLVAWLAQWFANRGVRVVLISRGYKGARAGPNDEARELQRSLPDVPHVQHPDRVAAARQAVDQWGAELLVLDDAFQHRRIHRDLDIVLIDALQPFGYGRVLPRGLLREPLARLARADVVGLSRAEAVDAMRRESLRQEIERRAPSALWMELAHQPRRLVNVHGATKPLDELKGCPVAAFCGIGNPQGLYHALQSLGYRIEAFRPLPDHYPYHPRDITLLERWIAGQGTLDAVLCTGKDLVKIERTQLGGVPLWALAIEIDIARGREDLARRLAAVLDRQEAGGESR
jgi:tetraacyldisaccharide 4'-kinase